MATMYSNLPLSGMVDIDMILNSIVNSLNKSINNCYAGKGSKKISELIRFIDNYIENELKLEEKYMIEFGYLDNLSHIAAHSFFKESFNNLKSQYKKDGPNSYVVIKMGKMLVNWFINHVRREDRKFAEFIHSKVVY